MTLRTRPLTPDEQFAIAEIEGLFREDGELEIWRVRWLYDNFSWTMAERVAHRVRIINRSAAGMGPPEIAVDLGLGVKMVRYWIKRFNAGGLDTVADAERAGRPIVHGRSSHRAYTAMRSTMITPPPELGLPYAHWSPHRLARYLREMFGLLMTAEELAARYRFQDYSGE